MNQNEAQRIAAIISISPHRFFDPCIQWLLMNEKIKSDWTEQEISPNFLLPIVYMIVIFKSKMLILKYLADWDYNVSWQTIWQLQTIVQLNSTSTKQEIRQQKFSRNLLSFYLFEFGFNTQTSGDQSLAWSTNVLNSNLYLPTWQNVNQER